MNTTKHVGVVGLTGSISTGKSTVSAMFAHQGARVIDADLLSREVVMPGQPAYARILEEFGSHLVLEDGSLDRKALGAIVFAALVIHLVLEWMKPAESNPPQIAPGSM